MSETFHRRRRRKTAIPAPAGDLTVGPGPQTPVGSNPLTVSQLSALIHELLAVVPGPIRVVGEVSNLSDRTHWFFSLKDEGSAVRCVCFASAARKIQAGGLRLQDGMQVVVTGRLDYYDAQGNLQLYVNNIELVGQGVLELRYRQLCQELRQLGYFDPDRKKPLPLMPRKVAVVTSRTGAALQDVLSTAQRRWAGCKLVLIDVHVQGASAAPEVAAAIEALSKHGRKQGVDVILLTRGGGSIEDLWAFNERIVADAIYRCELPLVAAIGHESDTTIAELVADQRCATPTQAVMRIVPDATALSDQLDQWGRRLDLLVRRRVTLARQHLESLARHPMLRQPRRMVDPLRQRLDHLADRLAVVVPNRLANARQKLDGFDRQLQALSPQRVLHRGYSYTLDEHGKLIRSATNAPPSGSRITTMLHDGSLISRLEADGHDGKPSPRPSTKRKPIPRDDAPGLFA
ncbi:MAG: exodeoxyribonuclease VII large subunit [Phycisphaeraceae bacterium]|nr:exodeoxyribonuclease VII large subunit [Phycisphaeraceae bacterium]